MTLQRPLRIRRLSYGLVTIKKRRGLVSPNDARGASVAAPRLAPKQETQSKYYNTGLADKCSWASTRDRHEDVLTGAPRFAGGAVEAAWEDLLR